MAKLSKKNSNTATIPELNLKSNRLPVQVSVIVPSTNINKKIPPKQFKERIKDERTFFSDTFGGDTSVEQVGGYIIDEKGEKNLITEKGVKVTSSMSVESYNKHKNKIEKHITERQKEWNQDTVGYEVEGNFYTYPKKGYIDNDPKNKNIKIK